MMAKLVCMYNVYCIYMYISSSTQRCPEHLYKAEEIITTNLFFIFYQSGKIGNGAKCAIASYRCEKDLFFSSANSFSATRNKSVPISVYQEQIYSRTRSRGVVYLVKTNTMTFVTFGVSSLYWIFCRAF